MLNKKSMLIFISIILLLISGCSEKAESSENKNLTFTDGLGNEIILEKTPEKVISLSPAITEMLYALNLENTIVGTTDYCDYPEEAKTTPKVGGFNSPNMELIVEAEPDIIFIAAGVQAELTESFKKLGIKTFSLDAENINQVISNIELLGEIMNAEERADTIAADMRKRKDFIQEKAKNLDKPLVFFEIWNEPLLSAGPNTFIGDILNIAGGKNFSQDSTTDYPQVSLELLIEKDPDFYIAINHRKHTDVSSRPGFEVLKAITNNNYFKMEDDYVTLPGPRIIEGLEKVAEIIHPEIFK